jgi:hypothetical protein
MRSIFSKRKYQKDYDNCLNVIRSNLNQDGELYVEDIRCLEYTCNKLGISVADTLSSLKAQINTPITLKGN